MKKLMIFLLFFFLETQVFSQSKEYSLALNAGVAIPGNDLSYSYNTGFNLGLDFQNYYKAWSFFAEFNANIFAIKQEFYPDNSKSRKIFELTAGPRYFINLKNVHPFLDLGVGTYFADYSEFSIRFGLSTGIGAAIKLNEKTDVLIKAKYYPYYVSGQSGYEGYFSVSGGIKYNFNL